MYQELLGNLLFVNVGTRPDISFAINKLSRVTNQATVTHLKLLKQVACYLKGTLDLGLTFRKSRKLNLEMQVDSSWANGENRKSIFGFLVNLNGTPVSYKTKQQSLVALSSTEAEYIGMSEGSKELLFVNNLLSFLKIKFKHPLNLYNDNQAALSIG